ncbi:MAG: hypothetical protein HKN79_10510, partial [Flavobacteriales bacterium]|nr:hypothetical protein [Flavobacteriales bacterium]
MPTSMYSAFSKSITLSFLFSLLCGGILIGQETSEPSIEPGTKFVPFDPADEDALRSLIVDNPDLVIGPCEDFNVVLILDESGSIDDDAAFPGQFSQNEQEVRAATLGLATALNNKGGDMAIVEFSTESEIIDIDGAGPGAPGYRTIDDDFISDLSEYLYPGGVNPPANGTSGYEAVGWTNWEAVFDDVISLNSVQLADLVIFMTDGNPTAYVNDDNTTCAGCDETDALNQAIPKADAVKSAGSHIYAFALGENINLSNIASMTGPDEDTAPGNGDGLTPANSDYTQATFEELQDDFSEIVFESCDPAVLLEKTVYLGHDNGASCPGVEEVSGLTGDPVTYCFKITNLGDTYLELVSFTDADLGITEASPGLMVASGGYPIGPVDDAPANSITYYYETTIVGDLVNTASVQLNPVDELGEDLGLADVADSDTASVLDSGVPCGSCIIEGETGPVCPGSIQTYTAPITGICDNPDYLWSVVGNGSILNDNGSSIDVQIGSNCNESVEVALIIDCEGCVPDTLIHCGVITTVVGDDEAPTITPNILQITTDCGAPSQFPDFQYADNCTPEEDLIIEIVDEYDTYCGGEVVDWYITVTDLCGNQESLYFQYVEIDTIPPTIEAFDDVSVDCDEVGDHAGYVVDDQCYYPVNVEVDSVFDPSCGQGGVWTLTYTATDACGNSAIDIQTITLVDDLNPWLTGVPDDIDLYCTSLPPAPEVTAFDACDGDIPVIFSETQIPGDCLSFERTWSAVDDCGNSSIATQAINLIDTVAPEIHIDDPYIEIPCDEMQSLYVNATDDCDTSLTVYYQDI